MMTLESEQTSFLSVKLVMVSFLCFFLLACGLWLHLEYDMRLFLFLPLLALILFLSFLYFQVSRRLNFIRTDLQEVIESGTGARIRNLGNDEIGILGNLINLTLEHRDSARAEFERQRLVDPITGLPNRNQFLHLFSQRLNPLVPDKNGLPTLAVIALERFQRLNDSLGTAIGDQILKESALRITKLTGVENVSRVSGSEFALFLSHSPDINAISRFSEAARTWLEAPIPLGNGDREVHLKIRLGITTPADMVGLSAQEILRRGEAALHHNPTENTRTLALFNADLDRKAREQIELEKDLRRAIEVKEFMVAFQPIQNATTGDLAGFEALVRWKHPTRGMIPPLAFIPLAEELGLIEELGAQILSNACKQLMEWSKEIPALSDTFISVNLSPKQFYDPLLLSKVWHAVQSSGLPYSRLKLEITESSIMENPEDCSRRLNALHDLGIRLSLDDFGTGYSSFIHLDRFPVSTLKLDKSFVDKLLKDPNSPIVRSVATVALVMGYDLIAEGVEDSSQAECLRSLGCGYIQGYLYAKPMFPEAFMDWYRKLNAFSEPQYTSYVRAQTLQ